MINRRSSVSTARCRLSIPPSAREMEPVSSETTTHRASECSLMPTAARCRVPSSLLMFRLEDKGSRQPAALMRPPLMTTAPSCRGALLKKMFFSSSALTSASMMELLKNIFFNKAPLHDGAVVISGGRIKAAGCLLPLSSNLNISKELGTRHRAAVGMSEHSDALCVVVSEETGSISLAEGGMLKRHLAVETLERLLINGMMPATEETKKPSGGLLSKIRGMKK